MRAVKSAWRRVSVSASVASATGSGSITYALKDGSALPEGLTLAKDGTISGQGE